MIRRRRVGSVSEELVRKSREAALSAVQIYNNPLMYFKSESFIVLMIIAWTYLLHAYYRKHGYEYRYFEMRGQRRRFERTNRGTYKYWELERCLNCTQSPIDKDTANNLRFLIGLRHEVEHQMAHDLDSFLSGRYQACAINFNHYIKTLFGDRFGIDEYLSFSIQLVDLTLDQLSRTSALPEGIPQRIRTYIAEFDGRLTEDEFNNERFSYRLYFTKRLVNHPGQADRAIEFLDARAGSAQAVPSEQWVIRDAERPKFRPSRICQMMQEEGFPRFKMHDHTRLWQSCDARNPGKGFGIEIEGQWYWYERWVEVVRAHCQEHAERYQ